MYDENGCSGVRHKRMEFDTFIIDYVMIDCVIVICIICANNQMFRSGLELN